MITWPNNLIDDLARRQCVLYLGSGISHNSENNDGVKPKTWKSFLRHAITKLSADEKTEIECKIDKDNLLLACEILKRCLGDFVFENLLITEFQTPQFKTAEIHKDIFSLDSKIVATPNFDNIYETYANYVTSGTVVVKNYYDGDILSTIRRNGRVVLKLHGSISTPASLIFTQSDYAKARITHSSFYQILNALLITQTFLFLGAGLNDPDIKMLLENNAFRYNDTCIHYFVIPNDALSQDEIKIYSQTMNLSFLLYDKADEHKELKDSIKNLVSLVESRRSEMASTQSW